MKFGIQYQFTTVESTDQGFMNGYFTFRCNEPFDARNAETYPERLEIRVPGPLEWDLRAHFAAGFAQDKWHLSDRFTLSLGLRYDLEVIPLREENNPAFAEVNDYPVDKNNVSPRVGFAYTVDEDSRSVVRGGYGLFYDKTHIELISAILTSGVFSNSFRLEVLDQLAFSNSIKGGQCFGPPRRPARR